MKHYGRAIRTAALAVATLLSLCAAACAGEPQEVLFHFNWPVPSHAAVDMEVDDAGQRVHATFSLDLLEGKVSDELQLFMRDFKFLEMGSVDIDDPIVRAELAPVLAATAAIPPLIISRQGEFLRIDDWDRMIGEAMTLFRQLSPATDEAAIEHATALMKDPATRQQLLATSARDWNLWVGTWNNVRVRPGESTAFAYPMSLPWGGELAATAELTCLPHAEADTGPHQIQLRTSCTGPAFREALLRTLEAAVPPEKRSAGKSAEMRAAIGECSLSFDAVALTDPETLMPVMITSTRVITIGKQEKVEKRKYRFVWK